MHHSYAYISLKYNDIRDVFLMLSWQRYKRSLAIADIKQHIAGVIRINWVKLKWLFHEENKRKKWNAFQRNLCRRRSHTLLLPQFDRWFLEVPNRNVYHFIMTSVNASMNKWINNWKIKWITFHETILQQSTSKVNHRLRKFLIPDEGFGKKK